MDYIIHKPYGMDIGERWRQASGCVSLIYTLEQGLDNEPPYPKITWRNMSVN